MRLLILLLIFSHLYLSSCLNLLVYNVKFGRSHTMYMNRLIDTLTKHGHDVTNYQPIYTHEFNNSEPKLAKTISRELTFPIDFDHTFMHKFVWLNGTVSELFYAATTEVVKFIEMFSNNCKDQLKDEKLMNQLKAMNFDLAILEHFDPCGLVILEKLGIKKHITIYSMPMPSLGNVILGLPSSLSFVPDLYAPLTPKMTMLERAKNIVLNLFLTNMMNYPLFSAIDKVAKELVDPNYNFLEKAGTASFVFVNTDEVLDFPRPITHKVIYIGGLIGLSTKKSNELPKNLDKIFRESKKGVIYMSFGTVAPSHAMPEQYKKAFLEAFSEFPQIKFLWKYEKVEDNIAKDYSNVIIQDWFPQQDLLSHPKLLAFITHAGGNSLAEASYAGKPMLCLPLFADQFRNAQTAKWHGYGEVLDKANLTKEAIMEGIQKIINNQSYRQKAEEMARILSSKPTSAEFLFVKNVEFAAKFDLHDRLDMHGRHLNVGNIKCSKNPQKQKKV